MGNAQSQGRGQGKGGEQSRVSPGDSLQEEMESLAIIPDVIVTRDELMRYTGSQHEKRIYLCCKNIVYDVTSARDFYGPEGPYANFAGRDASRALALMSLKIEDVENTDLSDLNEEQLNVLNDWERKFKSKYKIVGRYQA
jgi:membrane-associated progesterone receptor component|tara:strand:- start:75 stop:494 length:420 start_codon:yes stop_codon:yes gene_type:complete|mmetsp:Transcript_10757/g.30558  ORF Transcript_10757/g.30558 Transcript_10757/m.30558 type:complete len:140 (-) Transcript_10757:2031-2450(-)